MSLMESVRSIVEEARKAHGFSKVARIVLEIGELAGVQKEAMTFCFDIVMAGSAAEGAELVIEDVPGAAWCPTCQQEVPVTSRLSPCPACGGMPGKVVRGLEMRVKGIEVSA